MNIIWFQIKERDHIKLFFTVVESGGAKESCLEAKNAEGWTICRLWKRKAKVFWNSSFLFLPFIWRMSSFIKFTAAFGEFSPKFCSIQKLNAKQKLRHKFFSGLWILAMLGTLFTVLPQITTTYHQYFLHLDSYWWLYELCIITTIPNWSYLLLCAFQSMGRISG